MKQPPAGRSSGRGLRVALLRSAFNGPVVDGLVSGARGALAEMGVREADLEVVDVPGAFELPLAALAAAESGGFDAVVALGAVIRGETDHYEHIAREAASGLAAVARQTRVPVAFGVLTCESETQARERSGPGEGNKGAEAAAAAVAMVHALRKVKEATESQRTRRTTRGSGRRSRAGRRERGAR